MIEIALLAALIIQQVYYMRQVQKLVDKLMSRSFYDYRIADTVDKVQNKKKSANEPEYIEEDTTASLEGLF